MRRIARLIPFWCLLVALLFPAASAAQTVTGSLQGTVTDATRAVLPGVLVIVKNSETGATREVVTRFDGSAPKVD